MIYKWYQPEKTRPTPSLAGWTAEPYVGQDNERGYADEIEHAQHVAWEASIRHGDEIAVYAGYDVVNVETGELAGYAEVYARCEMSDRDWQSFHEWLAAEGVETQL